MNINHPHHRIIHSPEEISTNCSPLLSPDLQQDIQGKEIVQDGLVLEPAIFTLYKQHIINQLVQKEQREGRLSYHNTHHALDVYESVEELLMIKKLLGERKIIQEGTFPPYEEQILYFAALFHDWVSDEKESAIAFDRFLRERHFSLYQRILGQGLIMGTTYPRKNLPRKEDKERDYTPQTDMEKILAIADLSGYKRTWEEWIDESLRVLQEGSTRPKTLLEWLKNQFAFLQYVLSRQTPESLVAWGLQLDEKTRKVHILIDLLEHNDQDPEVEQLLRDVQGKIKPFLQHTTW